MLSDNQKIVLQAALRGMPMIRLSMQPNKGDCFGSFATLKNTETRNAINAWTAHRFFTTDLLVYEWPISSAFSQYTVIVENEKGEWSEIKDLPIWPLDERLLARLKQQIKPHERKSKSFFSGRNRAIMALAFAAIWISMVGWGNPSSDPWRNFVPGFSILLALLWLYEHFIGDARKQRRFRNKVSDAIIAEGMVLYPSQHPPSYSAPVVPFQPKPAS